MEDKAATETGFVLFVRAVRFPSLLPSQAALSIWECPEALVIFPDCFMCLSLSHSLSLKKKGGGGGVGAGKGEKWNQSCTLGKRIPTYYRLEFSEVLLDLYRSQYASRTEML